MGIDRIEHFMGGAAFTPDKSASASYEHMSFDTPESKRIVALYKEHHTYFDATISAYGYHGKKDPEVFTYFTDEKRFLTPYMRANIDARAPRTVNQQFENIYWNKRKEIKGFYDAGGADLIFATINAARAIGMGDRLGSIEAGKWADFVVVRGNPLQDIRRTRLPRLVIKAGRVYDPAALMKAVEGKVGPMSAADSAAWAPSPRAGRGG